MVVESTARKKLRRTMMKRILISVVLALALAGTTAFAAQNKNAGKTKPAASKPAATGNMGATKGKGKRHKRHHRKAGSKAANSNAGGGMTKTKTKTKNSK
jgi:Ni/Co efflux regulator RcnB